LGEPEATRHRVRELTTGEVDGRGEGLTEPMLLEALTIRGDAERRSRGSIALVTITCPK